MITGLIMFTRPSLLYMMTSLNAATSTSVEALYELLFSLLLKCPKTIEVLPGDCSLWILPQSPDNIEAEMAFSPFLFTEEHLGVPQKILYQLYLHAVGVFKSVRTCVPTGPPRTNPQRNHDLDDSLIQVLIASTSILILANPSHETALNARKHLLRLRLIDPQAELRFMACLLSSQHCTKHAELWYHRWWLLSSAYDVHHLHTTSCRVSYPHLRLASLEMLHQELQLVSRACELYPRNYFAWTHRVICMRNLLSDYLTGMDTVGFVPIFRHEIAGIKEWIARHISDYSAVHFILTLSQAAFQSKDSSLVGIIIKEDLLEHAISLVQEYPAHEALWMYIQSALSISDSWEAQQTQQFVDHFVRPLAYSQHPKTSVSDDLTKASQYARQFLERTQAASLA